VGPITFQGTFASGRSQLENLIAGAFGLTRQGFPGAMANLTGGGFVFAQQATWVWLGNGASVPPIWKPQCPAIGPVQLACRGHPPLSKFLAAAALACTAFSRALIQVDPGKAELACRSERAVAIFGV